MRIRRDFGKRFEASRQFWGKQRSERSKTEPSGCGNTDRSQGSKRNKGSRERRGAIDDKEFIRSLNFCTCSFTTCTCTACILARIHPPTPSHSRIRYGEVRPGMYVRMYVAKVEMLLSLKFDSNSSMICRIGRVSKPSQPFLAHSELYST